MADIELILSHLFGSSNNLVCAMELRQTYQGNKNSVLSLSEDIPLQPGEISRNFTEKQLCFRVPACILCGQLVRVYIQRPLAICPWCLLVSAIPHKIVIISF